MADRWFLSVEETMAAMQKVVGEALTKPSDESITETIRETIERSGITDEFGVEQVEPGNYKVTFRPKVPLTFIEVTLPEGVSLTDEEIEAINAEYGGGS